MTEKNWQSELTAYIDGELPEAERLAVEAALAKDPSLKALEVKLRQTVALMKTLPAAQPSAGLKRSVLAKLEDERSNVRWLSWPKLVPVMTLAAAALVVLVLRVGGEDIPPPLVEEEQLALSQNMDVVEDLDLLGLASPEDVEIVEQLKDLEVTP